MDLTLHLSLLPIEKIAIPTFTVQCDGNSKVFSQNAMGAYEPITFSDLSQGRHTLLLQAQTEHRPIDYALAWLWNLLLLPLRILLMASEHDWYHRISPYRLRKTVTVDLCSDTELTFAAIPATYHKKKLTPWKVNLTSQVPVLSETMELSPDLPSVNREWNWYLSKFFWADLLCFALIGGIALAAKTLWLFGVTTVICCGLFAGIFALSRSQKKQVLQRIQKELETEDLSDRNE